jgi:hypothetical protein
MPSSTVRARLFAVASVVSVVVGGIAVTPATAAAPTVLPAATAAVAPAGAVVAPLALTTVSTKTLLGQLAVKTEHNAGYARSKFRLWTDGDRDGCNTRYEVLISEAKTKPRVRSGCTLSGGRWTSPYDGKAYTDPSKLDIDHLVPLAEAWASGAYRWTAATRTAYANDLGYGRSLVAVTASLNRSKGSDEPNAWLPPKSQCSYVSSWVGIKWRWKLALSVSEHRFLTTKLAACGWPRIGVVPRATVRTTTTTTTTTTSGPVAPSGTSCPSYAPIKGNASSMIYHVPGGAYYTRTNPEACFRTEAAAVAAGYRKSKL